MAKIIGIIRDSEKRQAKEGLQWILVLSRATDQYHGWLFLSKAEKFLYNKNIWWCGFYITYSLFS